MPNDRQKWQCSNNITNPAMAKCIHRDAFMRDLEAFWNRISFVPEDSQPEIAGAVPWR